MTGLIGSLLEFNSFFYGFTIYVTVLTTLVLIVFQELSAIFDFCPVLFVNSRTAIAGAIIFVFLAHWQHLVRSVVLVYAFVFFQMLFFWLQETTRWLPEQGS